MPVKHKTKARRKTIKPIKIAYHFNADHPTMTGFYGHKVEDFVFRVLLNRRSLNISSKVLTGDLLLDVLASETEESGGYKARKFSSDQYQQVVQLWLEPNNTPWSNVLHGRLESALCGNIFTICFETVDAELAGYVDKKFIEGFEPYLGALEVDESSHVHWWLYSNSIGPRYRVNNRNVSIFWDGVSEQPKDQGLVNWLKEIGFREVGFESLNGRYTIFDEYHSFEQARRVAEWKKQCGNLLAFIADEVAHKLGDAAPELGDKLWAMLKTFNEAETNEQFAQVTASCRRIVEYVSDQLFPPLNDEVEGRKLGVKQYRNRLWLLWMKRGRVIQI